MNRFFFINTPLNADSKLINVILLASSFFKLNAECILNITAIENNILKTAGENNWPADVTSYNQVYNNSYLQTIVTMTTTNQMIRLNDANLKSIYIELEYVSYLRTNVD